MKNSFVITIDDRTYDMFTNRFSRFTTIIPKKFNGFTIPNRVYKKAGIIKTNNVINCSLSHVALIKYAQMNELPFICVFEDDAVPHKDVKLFLDSVLSNIPDDCDMLKLGVLGFHGPDSKTLNSNLTVNNHTSGSHAYVIFNRYYQRYLLNMKINPVADGLVMNDVNSNIYMSKTNLFL